MKNFKYNLGFIAIVALLFTSCSKEESGAVVSDQETYQLQFGTLLNDFEKQSKVHLTDPTACRDADPSYVLVGVEDSNGIYIGTGGGTTEPSLFRVEIQNNNGSWETSYSEDLALPAGDYSLEYFIVYSADGEVLWVAPREGGVYASSVGNPLPQDITLGAGTKPYINVDVLCFNPRDEEAFGYVFFDINLVEVENNFCIFVNFCDDTTGREYPALFQVDVWADAYGGSDVVVDGEMNSISGTGNSFAATVLCFPLPPLGEGEVYYARVTVLDAGAYNADALDVSEFTISQTNIAAQLLATPRYEHVRINCGDDDGNGNECDSANPNDDCDDDGILNKCDTDNPNYSTFDCDGDTIANGVDNCSTISNTDQADFDEDGLGDSCDPDDDNDEILDDNENAGCQFNPDPNCGVDPTDPCASLPTAVCSISQTQDDLEEGCNLVYFDYENQNNFITVNEPLTDIVLENSISEPFGKVSTSLDSGDVIVSIDGNLIDDLIIAYEVEVRLNNEPGSICKESKCDSDVISTTVVDRNQAAINLTFSGITYDYPYYVRVKAISCGAPAVGP